MGGLAYSFVVVFSFVSFTPSSTGLEVQDVLI